MKKHQMSKRFDFINPRAVFLSMSLCNFPSGFVRVLGLFLPLAIKMCLFIYLFIYLFVYLVIYFIFVLFTTTYIHRKLQ